MRAVAEADETGRDLLEIFFHLVASIVLEIGYTRIFSFKLYYYYTYLIIGLALLGLGAGGLLVIRRSAPVSCSSRCRSFSG